VRKATALNIFIGHPSRLARLALCHGYQPDNSFIFFGCQLAAFFTPWTINIFTIHVLKKIVISV